MTTVRVWMVRLKGTLFPARRDADLEQELMHHLELAADAERRRNPSGAARDLAVRHGGLAQSMEALRDQRSLRWLEDLLRDLRVSLRTLRRTPTFTVVAVLTLGLGIGAAATIASVVDTILLRPLPYADADRLVRVVERIPTSRGGIVNGGPNFEQFLEWRRRSTTLADALAVSGPSQRTIRIKGETARAWAGAASVNAFTMLGVRPAMGRAFAPGDESNANVAILGFDAWQRIYHADPDIVGASFEVQSPDVMFSAPAAAGNRMLTVIGVLPRGAELPTLSADFYVPLVSAAGPPPAVRMIGHLRPEVSEQAARDEANIIGPAVKPPPVSLTPLRVARFDVQSVKGLVVERLRPALRVLLVAVGVLLLIVAANIANLLLARGSSRQREMIARLALGASRLQLIRLVLSECLLLAAAGGALGVLTAMGGMTLVQRLAALDAPGIFRVVWGNSILPRGNEVGIDSKMFAIAVGLAALTTLVFGILPVLQVSRTVPLAGLSVRGGQATTGRSRARTLLVLAQITMATVLLIGAGLLTRSFVGLLRVNNGYDPNHVLTFQLVFPGGYSLPRKAEAVADILARLRAMPDVVAAGMTRAGILIPEEITVGTFVPPSRTAAEMQDDPASLPRLRPVSAGYLSAMAVPVLDGREFLPADPPNGTPLIAVSKSVAAAFFGPGRAVGEVVNWHIDGTVVPMQVVGVVADVHNESPDREAGPDIFVEYRQLLGLLERAGSPIARREQMALGFLSVAVRSRGPTTALAAGAIDSVRAVDASIGVDAMIPMVRLAASAIARQRFYAVLLSVFAVVATVLAAIGVYGVLAYDVLQRTSEIGVRMALGAQRQRVLALVLRKGAALALVGVGGGLAVAWAATTLLQDLLFGVTALDPATFILMPLLFGVVAALASYIPAWRATKVNPIEALRSE